MHGATRDLEAELRMAVEGEVRIDAYSKALYSTDASIYQIEPLDAWTRRGEGVETRR